MIGLLGSVNQTNRYRNNTHQIVFELQSNTPIYIDVIFFNTILNIMKHHLNNVEYYAKYFTWIQR